jgi:hypothetical protein
LLEDYKSYGLALPPKNAPLVRLVNSYTIKEKEKVPNYTLGFLLEPATKESDPAVQWATWQLMPRPNEIKILDGQKLTVEDLDTLVGDEWGEDAVILAIQCKDRGWHSLARHLSEKGQIAARATARTVIHRVGWSYWELELSNPKSDWTLAARHLHALIQGAPELDTKLHRSLLKSLDAAIVPSKAKAGSIEAMIDGLMNAGSHYNWIFQDEDVDPAYRRLVEKGFEAVPELIKHLEDERLTRGQPTGLCGLAHEEHRQHYRVRDVVRDLLRGLAGEDLKIDSDDLHPQVPACAWWEGARQVGEEAYLLAHVLPKENKSPNDHLLWLLVKRYPQHLQTVYYTILDKRPLIESERIVDAIARSDLPRAKKAELFSYGARHESRGQRQVAFNAIAALDHEAFVEAVARMLDELPRTPKETYWRCPEQEVVSLVLRTEDATVWKALDKAARRVDVGLRMQLLRRVANNGDENERRKERLAFLQSFLDDATLRDMSSDPDRYVAVPAGDDFPRLEVRNYAALEIARLLKLDRTPLPSWDDDQWARFRQEVRDALKR